MKLNDIVYMDSYSDAWKYALANGYTVQEITQDTLGRRFQIQEIPQLTQKELAVKEISKLKQMLEQTDYQALKFAEGSLTEEVFAPIRAERQEWRDRINELEKIV